MIIYIINSFGLNNPILETKEDYIKTLLVKSKRQTMIQSLNRIIFNKKEEMLNQNKHV